MGLDAVVVVEQDALLPLDAPLGVLEPEPGVAHLVFQSPCEHSIPFVSTCQQQRQRQLEIITCPSKVVQGTGQTQIATDSCKLGAKGSEQKQMHNRSLHITQGPYPWNQAV